MGTALDIITSAMRKAGILSKSEVPSADEAIDALRTLNAMLSSWSNDSMLINARVRETFSLTGGVSSYTIGAGQAFNTARPTYIVDSYINFSGTDYPLEMLTDEVYDLIPVKNTQGIPQFINYDGAYPFGTIKLYPIPSASFSVTILSEKVLSSFTLADIVDLPPGWEQALIYNLAIMLAPEYGQQADPLVLKIANDSKGSIQRAVMKTRTMDSQPSAGQKGNVYNGWFR